MKISDVPKPIKKLVVMELLIEAGVDVSDWKNYKGKHPSVNPKYCYNWSFEQPGELFVVCIWYPTLSSENDNVVFRRLSKPLDRKGTGASVWKAREAGFSRALEYAYRQQLPVKVILLDGERKQVEASDVHARLLDPVSWAVLEFNLETGGCLLVRGESPTGSPSLSPDPELAWLEGKKRQALVQHRCREAKTRRAKIREAKERNDGKLICEVPGCGFDFSERYGDLGEGYAQVHHLVPLSKSPSGGRSVKLSELAIVCANCHAMVHLGGECRPLENLIHGQKPSFLDVVTDSSV
jgi:5-methylcytosine-specific restriction enzyme A